MDGILEGTQPLSRGMPYAHRPRGMAPLTGYRARPSVQGMIGTKARIGDRFIAGLAVWIVAVGAIIPSLDRELLGSDVTIESGHHETCAHPHHDHTICIQFGKQRWSSGSSMPVQVFPPAPGEAVSVGHDVPVEFLRRIPTRSRAPPHTT